MGGTLKNRLLLRARRGLRLWGLGLGLSGSGFSVSWFSVTKGSFEEPLRCMAEIAMALTGLC